MCSTASQEAQRGDREQCLERSAWSQAAERFRGSLSSDKERGNGRDRNRDADRTGDAEERERERARNRVTGEVRGGDACGYWRDDKGRKDGGRDAHWRQRDCYGRAVSPLRGQSARDEERERQKDRERERERERQRARNQESGEVRGGDACGYWRDDKGRKDGGRDAHGRHRDSYGDSRGSEKSPDLKRNMCDRV